MPKPDAEARALFESLVPEHPDVRTRPMFGNVAAFVNGNMFTGLYGSDVFVRLPEKDRAALTGEGGAALEPMPGRPMREYVVLPPPGATTRVGSAAGSPAPSTGPKSSLQRRRRRRRSGPDRWARGELNPHEVALTGS